MAVSSHPFRFKTDGIQLLANGDDVYPLVYNNLVTLA